MPDFSCEAHEILDPDYIPGSLKSVPSGSIDASSGSGRIQSSASSAQLAGRDVPATPAEEVLHQSKLQFRRQILSQTAGRSGAGTGTDTGASTSPSVDTANHPNIVTPPVEYQQQRPDAYTNPTPLVPPPPQMSTAQYGFTQATFETGPFSGVSGTAMPAPPDPTWSGAFIETGQYQQQQPAQYDLQQQQQQQQNFMATAMSMGLDVNADFGMGADFGGFGFDINNFSFDIGDFSSLLGNTQGSSDQSKAQGY